jgi:protein-L-isoaspartate(D-aspartate) O-methyltransferase
VSKLKKLKRSKLGIEKNRFNMIEQQIRTWNVLDENILNLFRINLRENYVPDAYQALAFADIEIPIGSSASMLPPKLEAKILEELKPKKNMLALHVGTGSGFFSALLASQVKKVITIDIQPKLLADAKKRHLENNIKNIEYVCANGFNGYYEKTPYDLIIYTASHIHEPPGIREQLNVGGKLFLFEGNQAIQYGKLITRMSDSEFKIKNLFEAVVPSLVESWEPSKFIF